MQILNILIPVDFSACSKEALNHAVSFSMIFDAKIVLLHVSQWFKNEPRELYRENQESEKLLKQLKNSDDFQLQEYRNFALEYVQNVETKTVRGNSVVEEIQNYISGNPCDLIIIGTHGRSKMSNMFLGGITEKVIKYVPKPILTVKDTTVKSVIPSKYSRILAPYDLSADSGMALKYSIQLAEKLKAELHIIHSVPFKPELFISYYNLPSEFKEIIKRHNIASEIKKKIAEEIPGFNAESLKYHFEVLYGKPSDSIMKYTAENNIDLIVMSTRGQGKAMQDLLGSTTDRVIRKAQCPVLVV